MNTDKSTDKSTEGFTAEWTLWSIWLLTLTAGVAFANTNSNPFITGVEGLLLLGAVCFAFYVQRERVKQEQRRG